ncbi:MAG: zinc ribbon domain-containing protein [Anaerolineae bacterium]
MAPCVTLAPFCPECGAKFKSAPHCAECGAKLTPGAKFCTECGTKTG